MGLSEGTGCALETRSDAVMPARGRGAAVLSLGLASATAAAAAASHM